jgi:hypothetical protein
VHTDEREPSIPPCELHLQPASGSASADTDPPRAELAKSDEFVTLKRQGSRQIEPCRNDFSDGSSVAVYYRNEEEVGEGFLLALGAMGVRLFE